MKILIWGTGVKSEYYLKMQEIDLNELYGFIETKRTKEYYCGKRVFEPSEVINIKYDYILVLVESYTREIKDTIEEEGIDINKVIFYDTIMWADGKPVLSSDKMKKSIIKVPCFTDELFVKNKFPRLFKMISDRRRYEETIISTCRNGKDSIDDGRLIFGEDFDTRKYTDDYFRCRTFELVADEIIERKIGGNCAELGVYQGHFSRLINKKFYDRKLYLFDTFDGFDMKEITNEIEKGNVGREMIEQIEFAFKDTSAEAVLEFMLYPDMCIIKEGLFPATVRGMQDEKYAFVSIDVDLEDSILEGLRYFYPRMSEGGYIFVHDYNNCEFYGVKHALMRYEREIGCSVKKAPIADEGGTLIIIK